MFSYKELSIFKKIWPVNAYKVYLLEKLHFHEYSMLYCDNQKDYIYSMKCDTFISLIYMGINKCVLIQGITYIQWYMIY